jgi:hypothetical protein
MVTAPLIEHYLPHSFGFVKYTIALYVPKQRDVVNIKEPNGLIKPSLAATARSQ